MLIPYVLYVKITQGQKFLETNSEHVQKQEKASQNVLNYLVIS